MSRDNFWQVEKGMTKKQENEPKNNVRDTDVSVARHVKFLSRVHCNQEPLVALNETFCIIRHI